MIDFTSVTAFRLVRRLALGHQTTSMYLLLHDENGKSAVEDDLRAEVEVQLDCTLPIVEVSELLDNIESLKVSIHGRIAAVRIDRWMPELVSLLDTHVIRLERAAPQFLFLTTPAVAERLLVQTPNFRNRLTDILRIVPDDPSGGGLD